jgi:ABC-type uncharacterized transport system substrate-binding protein
MKNGWQTISQKQIVRVLGKIGMAMSAPPGRHGSRPVLHAKQLRLARELVPAAALIGVLINPDSPKAELLLSDVQTAARTIGQSIHMLNASSEGDLEDAFATIVAQHVGALVVTSDAFFNSQFDRIVELAARHHVPTIYNGASMPCGRGARLLGDFICLSVPQTQN